ncbi:uncharacterized protein LOC124926938 [Impatiens glandulifera]|uniref:uncharacterized protein LOC124926938 n=1 Tax=Impatiens glandulifera TaxID=253017 RepID=UPI001FB077FB|nr:uncharacterized protein LOC124926938 [Impatiens glandulifera]
MDPCPFVRLIVDSLSLKLPLSTRKPDSAVYPSSTATCFCVIRIKGFSPQTTFLPIYSSSDAVDASVGFHLDQASLRRLSGKSLNLTVLVYPGMIGNTCGVTRGKLLGRVNIGIELNGETESKPVVFHNGWSKLGAESDKPMPELHLTVRTEPEPRFVFQFDGEPECSPVVFQIQGNIRQPVFSCKFSADRNARSRNVPQDFTAKTNRVGGWMRTFSGGERDKPAGKERKGWMIMIYDLSGSPVAAASMTTPFVASPGSDRVSSSNPGAWLILRPDGSSDNSWKPWGRLEAWRERGTDYGLGYKLELVTELNAAGIPIAKGIINGKKGGKFCIDNRLNNDDPSLSSVRGFVMCSTVEGEGKTSKPVVEVGVEHVTCSADAAVFVAVSAAIDLCMDACRYFSRKLRKEFCHDQQDNFS